MTSTRHAMKPVLCTACNDDRSRLVRGDADRPDAYMCGRCPYGHTTHDEIAATLEPGQVLRYHDGSLHAVTPPHSGGSARHTAPEGLTAYTLGVVRLIEEKQLHGTWHTLKGAHHFHFGPRGPHGPFGSLTIGARTGKILRSRITQSGGNPTKAEGTNAVRTHVTSLNTNHCPPRCNAATGADCQP